MKGTVVRWLDGRGYGFIEPDEGGQQVFVHHSDLIELYELKQGQRVDYKVKTTARGLRAVDVKLTK